MNINDDVRAGRQKKLRGCARLTLGEENADDRETTLGRLEYTTGILLQRRGLVDWRMQRARQRMAPALD
ncbi:MAG TPA: hypothetical protein VIU38_00665 [Anaerolineales bacterium]